jgi:hypothetical protein
MPDSINWMIVGDFSLCRSPQDRNKLGGDINYMYLFNDAISALCLVELALKGIRFTWTNKQRSPLLERLDWFSYLSFLDLKLSKYFCHPSNYENI